MKHKIIVDKTNQEALNKSAEITKLLEHSKQSNDFEYIFIIGGDGWFLKNTAPYLDNPKARIIFINAGTLGFYSYKQDADNLNIEDLVNEDNYQSISLLRVCQGTACHYAINDFVISSPYAINLSVYINNELLQNLKANGILITTPLGSTARSKSLGGAILMPNLPVMSITEIEPIHNRHYSSLGSPLVISNKDKIKISASNYNQGCSLISDGQVINIEEKDITITVEHATSKAKLLIKTDTKNWIHKLNYAFNNEN